MGLFTWLRSHGASSPTDFDRAVIAALADILPPAMASKLNTRMDAVDAVERRSDGAEVVFHVMDGPAPVFPAHTALFPDNRTIRFAAIESLSLHPPSRGRATVILTNGNLSGIIYDRPTEGARPDAVTDWHARLLGPPFQDRNLDQTAQRA